MGVRRRTRGVNVWRYRAYALAVVVMIMLSGGGSSRVMSKARASTVAPSSGTYTTRGFLVGAISVRLEKGWNILEDSRLHLSVAASDPDYRVLWSLDAWALHAGKKITGVPSLSGPLITWLRSNRDLRVIEAPRSTIGSKLRARVVDVRLAAHAVNDDLGCPAKTCVNFLRFYGAAEPYGIAGDDAIRFYFANINYKGKRHLLVIAIEAKNRTDLELRRPAAERLIHTAALAIKAG